MDEDQFRIKFQKFPSSFNLKIEELKNSKAIQLNKKKLEEKVTADEFESPTERTRIYNLLSFLHWTANEADKAYEYNRKALAVGKENIVTLFNRLWMTMEKGQITEANEELKKLEKLVKSDRNLLLLGKAEIAYCYSVFGPPYFLKSKNMLEELFRDIGDKGIDHVTLTLWKLDLGIIYRKLCNFGNIPRRGWEESDEKECLKRAVELLYEVACSDSPARWRGRCWASLAELLDSSLRSIKLDINIKELFPAEIKDIRIESLLDKAMETGVDDSHVFKVCGKLYRYLHNLDKAETVIRKSLEIRETAYAHHQLALILKQRLREKLFKKRFPKEDNSGKCNPTSISISHKTYVAKSATREAKIINIPGQSFATRHNNYSRKKIRATVPRNEKPMSVTTGKETSVNSSCRGADSDLQYTNTIKSTRVLAKGTDRVFSIPKNEEKSVQEILHHLDKAIKLGNGWACLDKGILLRQTKNFQEAFDVFLTTLKIEERTTAILEVSCYEQLGSCCRDLAEHEKDEEKRRKLETDAVIYWRKSLEKIASKRGTTLDFLKEEWMSYPVLKDMFQKRQSDVTMLKQLVLLGEILERPDEIRYFRGEISKLDEMEAKDPTIICAQIKTLLKKELFEDAVQILEKCKQEKVEISNTFCKLVYLELAFHFLTMGEIEHSSEQFRQAFHSDIYISRPKPDYDIFLLYDEETERNKTAFVLAEKLEKFLPRDSGLRIISNSNNVKPGEWWRQEQTKQMESSIHIVLILDRNEEPGGEIEVFIKIAQEIANEKKSMLSIILVDGCTCPPDLKNFRRMHFERKLLDRKDDFIKWIRGFFFRLLQVDEMEE